MAELGTYATEAKGIADEFKELLQGTLKAAAFSVAESIGESGIFNVNPEELEQAYELLSQTPSQRQRVLARLDDRTAAMLVMRARYLGLVAAQAMRFSEHFDYIRGKGYRKAAVYAARKVMTTRLKPPLSSVLPGWSDPDEVPSEFIWPKTNPDYF